MMRRGRPRKRPLDTESTESLEGTNKAKDDKDVIVFDIVPPSKKSKHQTMFEKSMGETSSHTDDLQETPILRRSTRRRKSVQEIMDKDVAVGSSSVFDTPPSTSAKFKTSRRKSGRKPKNETKKDPESLAVPSSSPGSPSTPVWGRIREMIIEAPKPPPTLVTLPHLVQRQLLRYLDVSALENLSQTCSHFDQLINGSYLTSIGIPFDSHFVKELAQSSSVDKKPLLKITCNKPREPYKRVGQRTVAPDIFPLVDNDSIHHVVAEMGSNPATMEYLLQSQLAMVTLGQLRELDLVPEEARDMRATGAHYGARILDGFLNYDRALLRHLCFSRALENITRLEVMVDQALFVADHLGDFKSLQELGLSIVAKTGMSKYWFVSDYLSKLEDFVEKLPISTLKLDILAEPKFKVQKVFRNKSIRKLVVKGPCTFYLHPVMENLKEIEVQIDTQVKEHDCCSYFGSRFNDRKQHRLGLCVVNIGATFQHCPKLETFNGLDMKSIFKEKKNEETTFNKWNLRVKKMIFEEYQKSGGTKDMKQWAKARWFTKRTVIPTDIGRNRVGGHINAFLFHM